MAIGGGKTLTVFLAADLKKFNTGMSQAQGGISGFAGSLKNLLGPAAIGAGIAIAGLATKMAVDGVNAALSDEEAMRKLALTMENVGLAHDTQKVEDYISTLERSLGIADDELRPAYDRLVRSLGDTEAAQDALKLALDVSAGSGKSLQAVTEALGKAYDGNISGLSRLGAGIDASVIASGDMQAITQTLANTFSGQAAESADTLRGRMQVLSTAVDNLEEAFGRGLLSPLADTSEATTDAVKKLEQFESTAEAAGTAIGNVGVDFAKNSIAMSKYLGFLTDFGSTWENFIGSYQIVFAEAMGQITEEQSEAQMAALDLKLAADLAGVSVEDLGEKALGSAPKLREYETSIRMTTEAYRQFLAANSVSLNIIKNANKDYKDLAARQAEVNTFTSDYIPLQSAATNATSSAASAVETLTKKEKELIKLYEKKNESLDGNREALAFWSQELANANDAIADFTTNMQENLLAGVDLQSAYEGQFDKDGAKTGESWVEAFNKQVEQAEWFGNVLTSLQAAGADVSLVKQLASLGPEVGGAIASEMLAGGQGMIDTLSEKWIGVQDKTRELAMGLVPEFLIAGQESALTMIDSISEQMAKEVNRLAKIGKKIAKPLGQSFKAELMKDVAAALREVEAAGAAGRAEAVAKAEAKQVALTNQAVAQALQDLVRNADQRNGKTITPVIR